ncbi:MAG TPA: DUF3810 domain-containing protein [Fastidiosipila sp.]|nr:DUF3810 domain-containing protein [Fastidiosipila sp.]
MNNHKVKPRLVGSIIFLSVTGVLALVVYFLRQSFIANPELAERYANTTYRTLVRGISSLSGLVPFSLTEAVTVLGVLFILYYGVRFTRRLIVGPWRVRFALKRFIILGAIALLIFSWFTALHGFNYERRPLSYTLALDVRPREKEELKSATIWLLREAQAARSLLPEDEDGVAIPPVKTKELLQHAVGAYDRLAIVHPVFKDIPERQIKPVLLSRYWSYTGVTGMYNPILVESSVNIDQPSFLIPYSALHEAAHVGGFAKEDEANFLAFLSGIYHPEATYRYASLYSGLVYVSNRLYQYDKEAFNEAMMSLDPGIARDMKAHTDYWKQFKGPVKEVSKKTNDAFLKSQRQEDGVRSYGRMIDLLLAWHESMGDVSVGLEPMPLTDETLQDDNQA